MKRSSFLFFFLFSAFYSMAIAIPDSILVKCNTAKNINYLSEQEKNVVLYINIARCYPIYFYDAILTPYMNSLNENKKTKYHKSLKQDLRSTKGLHALQFNESIYPITKKFASDMGQHGKTGHVSPKGENLRKRMGKPGLYGENCSYGFNNALDIVYQLMLDEGETTLGHRKNILDPDFGTIAVSIQKHKKYTWNCVMDFTF